MSSLNGRTLAELHQSIRAQTDFSPSHPLPCQDCSLNMMIVCRAIWSYKYMYMRLCLSALLAKMCSVVIRHINTPHPRSHTHITAPTCSISGQYAYAVPHARCSHRTISKMERTRGAEKGKRRGKRIIHRGTCVNRAD
jgi:hypothetical protein